LVLLELDCGGRWPDENMLFDELVFCKDFELGCPCYHKSIW